MSRNKREGRYAGKYGMPNSRGKYVRVHKRVGNPQKLYALNDNSFNAWLTRGDNV